MSQFPQTRRRLVCAQLSGFPSMWSMTSGIAWPCHVVLPQIAQRLPSRSTMNLRTAVIRLNPSETTPVSSIRWSLRTLSRACWHLLEQNRFPKRLTGSPQFSHEALGFLICGTATSVLLYALVASKPAEGVEPSSPAYKAGASPLMLIGRVVGAAGLEPAHGGVRARCLCRLATLQ